ncbi:MAG: exodeoxyribonuclease VII large subunit [Alphaproteobacteria bacterium]|nr:exodeoxyribonuclease VII large subunit [Alphaproteobacteria bacterium]
MSDPLPPGGEAGGLANLPIFSVSEISAAIKRTMEDTFSRVRIRGEVSGLRRPGSGHLYMDLKDEDGVIAAVCWRGVAGRLAVAPEDGLEIIVTGRITTYGPQSKYQVVIEDVELAGEGALLKLIEERRKKLAAEGLFDEERKRELPFLPEVIGVVTSPTGAVIRDILHRLSDRFPRHVVIWPALVQGKEAPAQVAAGIRGFNALAPGGPVARPDVIIVARGGGSLEDLMAFNEEIVVRAAAESEIPLISAVGHETDVTLIDFAADRRAPTPSAAAEMAVPVRMELAAQVANDAGRLAGAALRLIGDAHRHLGQLWRVVGDPRRLVEESVQRLDDRGERLRGAGQALMAHARARFADAAAGLRPRALQLSLGHGGERLAAAGGRLKRESRRVLGDRGARLERLGALLASYSYEHTLARGFAVIRDEGGQAVMTAAATKPGMAVEIGFADGGVPATIGTKAGAPRPKRRARPKGGDEGQGTLL